MATTDELRLKSSLKLTDSIESFYTGGKVEILRRNVQSSDDNEPHRTAQSSMMLATTYGEDVILTDIQSGKKAMQIKGSMDTVTCFSVKPDAKHIVIAYQSLMIKTVDLATNTVVKSWKAHEAPVLAMDFDPTSTLVATGSADSTIKVWDVDRGYCTHNFKGHGGIVSIVKFHPDPNRLMLVSGSDDCKICVWDLNQRSCAAVFTSHVSVIRGLDFSVDGRFLYSGARDKVVNVWDIDDLELVKTMPVYESVEAVAVVKCQRRRSDEDTDMEESDQCVYALCTGGEKGILRFWDLDSGDLLYAQERKTNARAEINAIVYDQTTSTVMTVMSDQNLVFYSASMTGESSTDLALIPTKHMAGYNEEILDMRFMGENDSHLAVATNTEQIRVYNIETHDCEIVYGHKDTVVALAVSGDGKLLVSGSKDHTAMVWRVVERDQESASEQDSQDESGAGLIQLVATCSGHTEPVTTVAASVRTTVPSRDRFIVTGSEDRTVKLWDLASIESGRPATRFTVQAHDKSVQSVAVAPNDKYFATAGLDKVAKLWNTTDGSLQGVFRGHRRGVWCVRFSPVDRVVATASTDKTIKVWSMSSFECLYTLEGHMNTVLNVSFVSAGLQLVSTSSDGLVKLWTVRDSECVGTFDGHEDRVWALAVDRSEEHVVSGGADAVVRVWTDVTVEEQEEREREDATRIVREQDLALFVRRKEYRNAVMLALELDQPMRLLSILGEARRAASKAAAETNADDCKDAEAVTGSTDLDAYFKSMQPNELERILLYMRDWNTSSRHADTAQQLLNLILRSYPSEVLADLPRAKEVFEALVSYTERHYSHADEMLKKSRMLDYALECMRL